MREIRAMEAHNCVLRATKSNEEKDLRWTKKTLMKRIRSAARLGRSSYNAYWDESASMELRERIEKWLRQLGYRVKVCEGMSIIDWEEPQEGR